MTIDWNVVATITAPLLALFVGVWVNRRFESRPTLISYFSHVSSFLFSRPDQPKIPINTHSVVLRNAGRQTATGVRVHHSTLPDFNIWPSLLHCVDTLPDGTKDIVIPKLIPGEQITISYFYFHPLTFNQINDGIKCDQGFAQQIPVLLQRQYPRWLMIVRGGILLIGLVAITYGIYSAILMSSHR